eukprot:bmy_18674T0
MGNHTRQVTTTATIELSPSFSALGSKKTMLREKALANWEPAVLMDGRWSAGAAAANSSRDQNQGKEDDNKGLRFAVDSRKPGGMEAGTRRPLILQGGSAAPQGALRRSPICYCVSLHFLVKLFLKNANLVFAVLTGKEICLHPCQETWRTRSVLEANLAGEIKSPFGN